MDPALEPALREDSHRVYKTLRQKKGFFLEKETNTYSTQPGHLLCEQIISRLGLLSHYCSGQDVPKDVVHQVALLVISIFLDSVVQGQDCNWLYFTTNPDSLEIGVVAHRTIPPLINDSPKTVLSGLPTNVPGWIALCYAFKNEKPGECDDSMYLLLWPPPAQDSLALLTQTTQWLAKKLGGVDKVVIGSEGDVRDALYTLILTDRIRGLK